MRLLFLSVSLFLAVAVTFGQSDRGTVTGTVSDATGAVIPGASVVAANTETATRYETVSTETGNYALSQLPAGVYQLSVELRLPEAAPPGGKYEHQPDLPDSRGDDLQCADGTVKCVQPLILVRSDRDRSHQL